MCDVISNAMCMLCVMSYLMLCVISYQSNRLCDNLSSLAKSCLLLVFLSNFVGTHVKHLFVSIIYANHRHVLIYLCQSSMPIIAVSNICLCQTFMPIIAVSNICLCQTFMPIIAVSNICLCQTFMPIIVVSNIYAHHCRVKHLCATASSPLSLSSPYHFVTKNKSNTTRLIDSIKMQSLSSIQAI